MHATTRQLRMIWALSHQRGLDESALRPWVVAASGQGSLRKLTSGEASQLIDGLRHSSVDLEAFSAHVRQLAGRPSPGQRWVINQLARELGWSERQAMRLARHMYRRARRRESLTPREASGLIEALKAIRRRRAA